jgi:hypothetical protein
MISTRKWGDLRAPHFRVEIIGADDAADIRALEAFPQDPGNPAVGAPAHAVDVQNGFHIAKLRLIP